MGVISHMLRSLFSQGKYIRYRLAVRLAVPTGSEDRDRTLYTLLTHLPLLAVLFPQVNTDLMRSEKQMHK
jgi:hypothetical protein